MEQEKMVPGKSQDGPGRLIASVVLAFVVMVFINGFIGSMGGMPAFLAFLAMFYMARTRAAGKWQPKEMPDGSGGKKETAGLFAAFSLGYLLIWSLLRVVMTVSRVTGWGNLSGASAAGFVRELFQTSLLEKTAYLAAGILMFTFVLSLFPLAVMKSRRNWVVYALVDAAVFALVFQGIGWISSLASQQGTQMQAACLVDQFLLCRDFALWQDLLALLILLMLMAGAGMFSFLFAVSRLRKEFTYRDKETSDQGTNNKRNRNLAALICGLAAVAVVCTVILLMPADTTEGYGKVAEFLTEDSVLGPMVYGGRIYVPVDEELALDEDGTPQGYLAGKDENCASRFYRLAVANLLYSDAACQTDRVQMKGKRQGVFAPIETVEKPDEDHSVYVLWDEEWEKESAYSHEPTGYTVCNEGLMEGLVMQFPKVTCRPRDFEDYDAYFTIRAYGSMEDVLEGEAVSGQWAGCILVKDEKFYYGNYDNQITGICLQQLREVLGGNQ